MLAIVLTLAAAVVCQLLRFRHPLHVNRLWLCATVLSVSLAVAHATGWANAAWVLLPFVVLAASCYSWVGSVTAAFAMWSLVAFWGDLNHLEQTNVLFGYLGTGGLVTLATFLTRENARRQDDLNRQLYRHARQLQIQNEIVVAMQTTMELPQLLHIILTAITAGYGLAFNRALLFLAQADGTALRGTVGIGSMTATEGFGKWERAVAHRMTLTDYIAERDRAVLLDHDLNNVLRMVTIPLTPGGNVVSKALQEGRPVLVRQPDPCDPVLMHLHARFGMTECAIVPMVNRGKAVGVIVVDNNVNHHAIAVDDLGSLMQMATQASLSIVNAQLFEQSHQLSITDALTGLHNQRFFHERLELEVERADTMGRSLGLLLLDVDYFKRFNDTNGHSAGNEVLSTIGALIGEHVGSDHIACRFGGEEFVLLLPGVEEASASALAEAIRTAVEGTHFPNRDSQLAGRVTISAGLAFWRKGMSSRQLLDAADQAMYEAKRNGRNQVQVFVREKVCS